MVSRAGGAHYPPSVHFGAAAAAYQPDSEGDGPPASAGPGARRVTRVLTWITRAIRPDDVATAAGTHIARSADRSRFARPVYAAADAASAGGAGYCLPRATA
jgi:hypothetical protein